MPTRPMVSEEEYLRMHFDGPDREYVDGEIVERHMGEKRHGRLEAKLAQLLSSLEKSHRFYTVIDTRMKVQARTYRIPDVAVFREEPADVPDTPPLLIIEVLSPDDSFIEVRRKCEQYRAWGVPHIYVADPWAHKLLVYDADGMRDVPSLALAEFDFIITPDQMFD